MKLLEFVNSEVKFNASTLQSRKIIVIIIPLEGDFTDELGEMSHILRHTGNYCPNGLLFHQISLDMGAVLIKKKKKKKKTLRNGF